jgi:four helix bundle protein
MQMRRSAVNTASYIADGHGKSTDTENRKQLGNARGALNELQTQVELADSLSFFPSGTAENLLDLAVEVAKLLNGLMGVLNP